MFFMVGVEFVECPTSSNKILIDYEFWLSPVATSIQPIFILNKSATSTLISAQYKSYLFCIAVPSCFLCFVNRVLGSLGSVQASCYFIRFDTISKVTLWRWRRSGYCQNRFRSEPMLLVGKKTPSKNG